MPLRGALLARLESVLAGGRYVLGPEVEAFEAELAAYLGVRHVIGVANGTDAITIALRALGVAAGDEVVLPSFTFYATAEAAVTAGARPVFCDVDPDTRNVTAGHRPRGAHATDEGDHRRRPVRLPRAGAGAARAGAAGARRRRAGDRRARSARARRARSATPPRSRSTRRRTSAASATAARSRPTTTRSPSSPARCASTARATSRASSTSATTRASTSSRRRSCGCCCPSSTAGPKAAAPRRTPTWRRDSASTSVSRRSRRTGLAGLAPVRGRPRPRRRARARRSRSKGCSRAATTAPRCTASRRWRRTRDGRRAARHRSSWRAPTSRCR